MTASRRARERRGRTAERRAALALILKGYRILARRFRTPAGEIDLVARRGGTVAFIEVKARKTIALAAAAVAPRQRRRIVRAAAYYAAANPAVSPLVQRFDAVLVAPRRWPHHIINAWPESAD